MRDFKELIGKKITKLYTNPEHTLLMFKSNEDTFCYEAEGDCCSSSWFESIAGLSNLLDSTITDIVERKMPEPENNNSSTEIKFYGWTLITDKGYFDIEMRNESNGYYGGSVHYVSSVFFDEGKEVTKDF